MIVTGVLPNTISYNTLAYGYAKVKRTDLALMLLKDMIRKGLQPNDVTRDVLKSINADRKCHAQNFKDIRV
ncbi:hypothetical protein TIFTF001_043138 [Ficus carica]|uniref:Pentatricopeptide repeat-containing protein n=1 Tax=Ficus carica TaxID=3494 RepID=A0AA87YWL2_FICCA|nr:hypothetical protein TIFTF001_043137 [Ficus carica]GMN20665.1 hypothetical protein TIFTF001_043138 [Ficus carica]